MRRLLAPAADHPGLARRLHGAGKRLSQFRRLFCRQRVATPIAALCGLLVVLTGAAAASSPLVDLVCATLEVKDEKGKTRTSLDSNGNAKIGGTLTVDGEIKSKTVTEVANRLTNLEAELKATAKVAKRFADLEDGLNRQRAVIRYSSKKPEFCPDGGYPFDLNNLKESGWHELALTITHTDGRLAAMRCLVWYDAANKRSWVLCKSADRLSTPDFEVKLGKAIEKGGPQPATAIVAGWSGGRYLTVISRRVSE